MPSLAGLSMSDKILSIFISSLSYSIFTLLISIRLAVWIIGIQFLTRISLSVFLTEPVRFPVSFLQLSLSEFVTFVFFLNIKYSHLLLL